MQIGYGDLAQTLLLRRHTAAAKADITRLSQEVTTGLTSDTARHLSGNLGQVNAIDAAQARLAAYGTVTDELGPLASALQSGLGVIADLADTAQAALLPAAGTVTTTQVDGAAAAARSALDTMMSTLATRFGDRSLFGGSATATTAVGDSAALLAALGPVVAGATDAESARTAISDWFDDPAGFAAQMYHGSDPAGPVPVAEGVSVRLQVTANDPALREVMKGLAMGALLDDGLFAGQPEARADLAAQAGQSLLAAGDGLTQLAARLGSAQEKIADAATRNTAESSALDIARVDLLGVDSYDASTRLTDAEDRLQLLYTLTSRLSDLSLVNYL